MILQRYIQWYQNSKEKKNKTLDAHNRRSSVFLDFISLIQQLFFFL